MNLPHFTFTMTFALALLGLTFHRTHLLSALLCLEGMMLSLFVGLSLWGLHTAASTQSAVPLLVLAFSACEAGTGLALLVATSRTHGSDQVRNLSLLQC
uniref:NADH-ubiquinone oxidoreductase chain 4L n=1 Tax=Chirocentrus dorab TaxID=221863 RepID=A0A679BAL9_9TELE|nr:NADH dehydrogenase subunit 4L [Chirocentrus dorab]